MIIRERVYEARIAARITKDPTLAKEFGIELSNEKEDQILQHLDNRITLKRERTSSEA